MQTQYVANLSTLYAGLPRDERPKAAAEAGFTRVESWWDFDSAVPPTKQVEGFLQALQDVGVQLVAMNSHGGDRAAGERGLACLPDRVDEFRKSIKSVAAVARRTGARKFNVTFGQLHPERWSREEQFETARNNYVWAAAEVGEFGGTILIEALVAEGNGTYPFHTGYDVVEFIEQYLPDVPNVGFLFDTFHLASNGVDVQKAYEELAQRVSHIQFADFPGRGAPDSGHLDFAALTDAIDRSSYDGEISLEYLAH